MSTQDTLENKRAEIDRMINTLEEFLEKWNKMKVSDYQYTINKFDNLITSLRIHRNMIDHQIEFHS